MRSDAHVHLDAYLEKQLQEQDIKALISCATPQECERAQSLCKQFPHLSMSCGIHPWHVDTTSWEAMLPWLHTVHVIGEIGMDNVWCSTKEALQEQIFVKQLAFAREYHKPVILHTKGQEKRIAEIMQAYPNTYLVHWYSGKGDIDAFRKEHTYFSIGPSVWLDESVQKVVQSVDIEHLLIETDGIAAIAWALHQPIQEVAYQETLDHIADYIAMQKQMCREDVWKQININYERFLQEGL